LLFKRSRYRERFIFLDKESRVRYTKKEYTLRKERRPGMFFRSFLRNLFLLGIVFCFSFAGFSISEAAPAPEKPAVQQEAEAVEGRGEGDDPVRAAG
jgi:hypothetical protein